MSSRNELAVRARNVGLDHTAYPNDSKLEQKVLWLEKNGTTFSGTLGTQTVTASDVAVADETITVGNVTYTWVTALSETKASATLTSDATAPSDGDIVTIDGITYVYRTTLTNTVGAPYEVLIGANAAAALDNIKAAINDSGTEGTNYGQGTFAHPTVTATTNTDTTQLVVAKNFGTYANGYVTVTTSTHLSWDGATLGDGTAGVNAVPNEIVATGTAATDLDNFKEAINGGVAGDGTDMGTNYSTGTVPNPLVTATTNTDTTQVVQAIEYNVTNGSVPTTETMTNWAWGSGTLTSGVRKAIAVDNTTVNGSPGLSGDKDV